MLAIVLAVVVILAVVAVALRRPRIVVATAPLEWVGRPLGSSAGVELDFVFDASPAFELDLQLVAPKPRLAASTRPAPTRRQRQLQGAKRRLAALLSGRIRPRRKAWQIRFWKAEVERRAARAA